MAGAAVTRRGATKAIILAYLRIDRNIGQMQRYMSKRHGINGPAVREQVRRLMVAGSIERIERGRYRRVSKP